MISPIQTIGKSEPRVRRVDLSQFNAVAANSLKLNISPKPTGLAMFSFKGIAANCFRGDVMIWLLGAMLFGCLVAGIDGGSCREAQLCCTGRDSSCVVQKAPVNAIIDDLSDKPCYCDHACLKLGDCCTDFKDHCGVLDCRVSDWGPWSECDAQCGKGMMTRSRTVLQASQNGGKHCPSLVQKRDCEGSLCHGHLNKKLLHEKALLLPASLAFRKHQRPNNSSGQQTDKKNSHNEEYCIEFEVLRASKACRKLPPYDLLSEGDRVSVLCDLEAFIEDSFLSIPDTYSNTEANQQKTLQKSKSFITPSNNNNNEIEPEDEEENSDENLIEAGSEEADDYNSNDGSVGLSSTTSTTTTTTFKPSLESYHCRGEGVTGRATHWSALPAPSCHGKWLRLTVGAPKLCSQPQFMFV